MSDIGEPLLYGVGTIVGIWLAIAAAGAIPLLMLSRVDLKPLPPESAQPWLETVFQSRLVAPQWLAEQGFAPIGVYKVTSAIGDPHMVVWQRRSERTYFCVYVLMGAAHNADFVTSFDEGGLTTGTTRDGLLVPPRPGHGMQAFKVANAVEQWMYHAKGLRFLNETIGKTPSTYPIPFHDEFVDAVRGQVANVRSIPLWFLRIPYWYVARRYGLFGKTVEQQYDRHGAAAAMTP